MAKAKLPADCMPMCRTCSFRIEHKKEGGTFCHRYPPVPISDEGGFGFTHVPVADDDFCGEYRRSTN